MHQHTIWLIKQTDAIIFGLTTNLLCIFDICWVSTQSYLLRVMFINFELLPIFQLEFLGLVIPFHFFVWDVSIIVTIISNITVLQCYLLWIFVSIRRLLQLIVCIGVSTPPHLKNTTAYFAKSPLKSKNEVIHPPPPPPKKNISPSPPPPPPVPIQKKEKRRIFQWSPIILKIFITNPIPSFKSN